MPMVSPAIAAEAPASMQWPCVRLFGCDVAALTLEATVAAAAQSVERRQVCQQLSINAAKVVELRSDPEVQRAVREACLISADGMAVVWAAKLLGRPLPGRVPGIDLMYALLQLAAERGWRPYFLGARQEILERAVTNLRARFPGLQVAGMHHGYFAAGDEARIVEAIAASRADLLFVAMSTPHKERFLSRYKHALGVPYQMGVGGSLDVAAGLTRRAPVWMQRAGFEWFYRFAQEPRRLWRRYLVNNARFAGIVAREFLGA